jgi:hypothetical protein
MEGFMVKNQNFVKNNFANEFINDKPNLDKLRAGDFDSLLKLQNGLVQYVEQYLMITGSTLQPKVSTSGFAKVPLKTITTSVEDPMDIGVIDYSNENEVKNRLK